MSSRLYCSGKQLIVLETVSELEASWAHRTTLHNTHHTYFSWTSDVKVRDEG